MKIHDRPPLPKNYLQSGGTMRQVYTYSCIRCETKFESRAGNCKYCPDCRQTTASDRRKKAKKRYWRIHGKEYYAKNKDRINTIRNERRHKSNGKDNLLSS